MLRILWYEHQAFLEEIRKNGIAEWLVMILRLKMMFIVCFFMQASNVKN